MRPVAFMQVNAGLMRHAAFKVVKSWLSDWKTLFAGIIASLVLFALASSFAVRERSIYNDFALERLQRQASSMATASATLLNEVDQTLLFVGREISEQSDRLPLRTRLLEALRVARETTQLPSSIFALNAQGRLFVTDGNANPDPYPLADVDYAKAHLDDRVEGVFVGAARLGRLGSSAGRWILGLSRAVRNADGELIAIIVATIPIERLTPIVASAYGSARGVGTWVALDGRVLMRDPFIPDSIVNQPDDQRVLYEKMLAAQSSGTTVMSSYADGHLRTIAWQRSDLFPVAAAVAVSTTGIMGEWDRTFAIVSVGTMLFCAALIIGGYAIDRLRLISDRQRRLATDRFEHLLGGIEDIFVAVDQDLKVTEFNSAAAAALGSADVIGRSLLEIFPELEQERNKTALCEAIRGRTRTQLQVEQPSRGEVFSLHVYPFLDGVAILAERVTERVSIEARLHQSQKIEALGQLTGGIAHDFNNLLTVIVGNAEALLDDDLEEEGRRNALGIVHGAEQATELIRQLLAFSRQQPLTPRSIDLNRNIAAMEGLLRRVLPETISITLDLQDVAPVWVDPTQFESALLNIVINARDAMPGGGKIIIETSALSVGQRDSMVGSDLKAGHYVRISVTDTGTGMAADIAARAFDPFFSTKPEGQGTGLGLSMVYGFARQSGGQVSIYSEPGFGTTVSFYLPQSLQNFSAHTMFETPTKAPPVGGTETILIVEDNPLVRDFARNTLRQLGYATVEADDAASAIALFDAGGTYDLVLSDVVLSGEMSGPALVETLKQRQHRFALLFMSGYPKSALKTAGALADSEVLGKPFKRDTLARAVRAALQQNLR